MTLYHRSADMLERAASTLDEEMVRGCQQDIADMNALAAELRAAAALDELVRENERLGLYDDQKPNAHELPAMPQAFADYMTKQMPPDTVISDPQWWARRIWRTAMRLHAAPAPAQPRQPVSDGELWSFLRSVMAQGIGIRADHTEYELFSARLDAAAAERVEQLRAITGDKP